MFNKAGVKVSFMFNKKHCSIALPEGVNAENYT